MLFRICSKTSAHRAAETHWRIFYSLASWQCISSQFATFFRNDWIHKSGKSVAFISWPRPDLAPSDLFLFGYLKENSAGHGSLKMPIESRAARRAKSYHLSIVCGSFESVRSQFTTHQTSIGIKCLSTQICILLILYWSHDSLKILFAIVSALSAAWPPDHLFGL
jgi:hypothetical protein